MEQLEKVEKLRMRANVSYEEAKQALEESQWDLLEAMVYLERQGKVNAPKKEWYSTSYEEQDQYMSVKDTVNFQNGKQTESIGQQIGKIFRKIWRWGQDNYFQITRFQEKILKIPAWLFVVVLLCTWHVSLVILLVALFFNCRYAFVGKDNLQSVNEAMDKAGDFADRVKDEYKKM